MVPIVVYRKKKKYQSTEPWGTPAASWCDFDKALFQDTLKDPPVR